MDGRAGGWTVRCTGGWVGADKESHLISDAQKRDMRWKALVIDKEIHASPHALHRTKVAALHHSSSPQKHYTAQSGELTSYEFTID